MGNKPRQVICNDCNKSIMVPYNTWRVNNKLGRPFRCKECYKIWKSKQFASMSEEDKIKWKDKLSKGQKQRWANKSEEERKEYVTPMLQGQKDWLLSLTEEERRNIIIKNSEAQKNVWANKTPEERKAYSELQKQIWMNKSDEEKQLHAERTKRQMSSLSEDEKKLLVKPMQDAYREWLKNSPDLRKTRNKKISNILLNRSLDDKVKTNIMRSDNLVKRYNSNLAKWFELSFNEHYGTTYKLYKELESHNYKSMNIDYTVLNNNEDVVMLLELDECSCHGGGNVEYGRASIHGREGLHSVGAGREQHDAERGLSIPDNIPFMIISEECKEKCFQDMLYILGKPYNEFIDWMFKALRSQPFPYPEYSDKDLRISFNRLCSRLKDGRFTPSIIALLGTHWDCQYGMHIVYNFYHSIWHDHCNEKLSPYEAYENDEILLNMIKLHEIMHISNKNKITQCFLISDISPRVQIFTPIMAMKVIYNHAMEYETIIDYNTQYGGILLACIVMNKKYIGTDNDLAHINESNNLIRWFSNESIPVNAKMTKQLSDEKCMCSYVPYGDDYINKIINEITCEKYVLIVHDTVKYQSNIINTYTTGDHWGEYQWHILILNKEDL